MKTLMKLQVLLLSFFCLAMNLSAQQPCLDWQSPFPTGGWQDFNSLYGGAPQMIDDVCPLYEINTFPIWSSEAYQVDGITAGIYYTFSNCNGLGAGSWIPDYTIIAPSGAVDAFGLGNGDGCSITWGATESGTYLIVINELGACGVENFIDNGFPALTCHGGISIGNIITGNVFIDFDCNGEFDGDEVPAPGQLVFRNGGIPIGASNAIGNFIFAGDISGITSLYMSEIQGYEINDFGISSDMPDELLDINFALCPIDDITNLAAVVSQSGLPPRPGFPVNYILCVSNIGTLVSDAELTFNYSQMPGLSVLNSAGGIDNGTEIVWQLSDIALFENVCFTVTFQVAVGTTASTILTPQVYVDPQPVGIIDIDYSNNTHSFHHLVVAAYDPNDKTVDIPVVNHTEIPLGEGVELQYLIRFQNTGNFYATFVRVVDELPELLDINTIHMINASHDYELSFPEPNVLEWFFDEIMLPDSTTDEPGSHGFIHFRIKTVPGVGLDDVIENNALIYFDFKEAVVTEYAVTTFMDCTEGSLQILGIEPVCPSTELVLTPSRNDFTSYYWTIGGEQQEGSNVSWTLTETSGVVLLAEHPVCQLSATAELVVLEAPEVDIVQNANMLTATTGASYMWYFNGELIVGANSQQLEVIQNGEYLVEVTFENGCENSASLMVTSVGFSDAQSSEILIMPNPARESVMIGLPVGNWMISLYDVSGKNHFEQFYQNTDRIDIELSNIPSGLYLIKMLKDEEIIVRKLIVE